MAGAQDVRRSQDTLSELSNSSSTGSDDLLADFHDLLSDFQPGAESHASSSEGAGDDLDELEAFLDEFEKNLDGSKSSGTPVQAAPSQPAPVSAPRNLEPEDLDLSFGDDAPVAGKVDYVSIEPPPPPPPPPASPPPPSPFDEGEERIDESAVADLTDVPDFSSLLATEEPEPQPKQPEPVAAFSGATSAQQPVMPRLASSAGESPEGDEEMKFQRPLLFGAAAVAVVGLLAGVGGVFLALETAGRVNELQAVVEKQSAAKEATASKSEVAAVSKELAKLGTRVNDLAIAVEGPLSHLGEAADKERQELQSRLTVLDERIASLEGARGRAKASKVAAESAKPSTTRAATSSSAAKGGGRDATAPETRGGEKQKVAVSEGHTKVERGAWVVNLISLSKEAEADEEVARLKKAGVDAEVQKAQANGRLWYRIRVRGFNSRDEAIEYISRNANKAGYLQAWPGRA